MANELTPKKQFTWTWRGLLRQHGEALIFSLFLGVAIWLYVDFHRTATREVIVPVEIDIPAGWQINGGLPVPRRVLLYGPQQVMQSLRVEELRLVEKIAAPEDARAGNAVKDVNVRLKSENLHGLSADLEVLEISDPDLLVTVERQVRRYLPVEVVMTGTLPEGYVLKNYQHSPQYVAVVAPESYFTPGLAVKTRPLDLDGRMRSFVAYTDLATLNLNNQHFDLRDSIFVQFTVTEKTIQKVVEKIPVGILWATPVQKLRGNQIQPTQVAVKVEGSEAALAALEERNLTVYIDSRDLGVSAQNEHRLKCRSLAPDDIKIVEIIPPEVRWSVPAVEEE